MFGVFPNGAGGSGNNGQSGNRGNNNNNQGGQGQDQGYSNGGNGFERSSGGTTVIANSVSNGRHGVATSHAIAYGNPRSSSQKWVRWLKINNKIIRKTTISYCIKI